MVLLVRREYKDQVWYEVTDAPRQTRHSKDYPHNRQDYRRSSFQADSLRGEGNPAEGIVHQEQISVVK
jgi:hypothetical protein